MPKIRVVQQGLLMTAYLRWLGVAEAELSLWRGAGALAGVAATFAYPRLHRAAGTSGDTACCNQRKPRGNFHEDTAWQASPHAGWCAPMAVRSQGRVCDQSV